MKAVKVTLLSNAVKGSLAVKQERKQEVNAAETQVELMGRADFVGCCS